MQVLMFFYPKNGTIKQSVKCAVAQGDLVSLVV